MIKFRIYSVLSIICALLFPIFTIINCIFDYYDNYTYLSIININSCGINLAFIGSEYVYIYWKVIATITLVIKLMVFIILPILSYFYKHKGLYIIQFILVALDVFIVMTLPNDYLIIIMNIFFHALMLFLFGNIIKRIDELEYY